MQLNWLCAHQACLPSGGIGMHPQVQSAIGSGAISHQSERPSCFMAARIHVFRFSTT